MNILLKSATIVDLGNKHHLKKRDVLIESGVIKKIGAKITKSGKEKEIFLPNLHISKGWFDPSVSFGEPGFEERETIENGLNTAALSGFTEVAVNANTFPVTDSKATIQYLKSKASGHVVDLHPIGALTIESKGVDLAELFDMKNEGAISFYDYKKPIQNPNLLKIALQYAQGFNGMVQSFPLEKLVAKGGMMNEEINSTRLGLKGIPALAESLQIARDLSILEYTGGKLHIPTISTKKSVELIKDAKTKGLDVSCSVAVANLYLTDDALESFDTNYKLMPPLRTKDDTKALLKGLKEGVIDGPIDIENKKTEFDHAFFGSVGLESAFGALNSLIDLETTITALTALRGVFGCVEEGLKEGSKANITLFDPNIEWTLKENDILSTSKNAAFLKSRLKGKAYGIYANKKLLIL